MDNLSFIDSQKVDAFKTVRFLKLMCFFVALVATIISVLNWLIPNKNTGIEVCYGVSIIFLVLGIVLHLKTDQLAIGYFVMGPLKKYGPPEEIAEQINAEMASDHRIISTGSETLGTKLHLHITKSWLIYKEYIMSLKDIIWVYGYELNGQLIKVFVYDKTRPERLSIDYTSLTNPECDERIKDTLTYLASRIPWAEFGYTAKSAERWEKDKEGFIRDVLHRKISHDKSR